ncbi:hypothetical protein [Pseudomonas serbica]|jgi:hypothetical protein|uniref:hypothetical protein n=1 Tax=Pseudomonas serbica TaxID=2965074 RepID=UPI0039E64107
MSDQSFSGLCERMKGWSVTLGWDAVVAMSRTKVNSLLEQQYISRFKSFEDRDRLLEKIYGSVNISDNGYSMLDLSGLILSPPRLSFENATLANSVARLTMEVESGTVTRRAAIPGYPSRVTDSFTVTPQQGFKVWMDIELIASTGHVGDQRRVIIDLGDAVNFSTNLLEDDSSKWALGRFLLERYKRLPEEHRVYELGMLDFNDDDFLVPREFQIRTQKAPPDNATLSEGGEGGAVVLFIRTRNNPTNGSTPTKDSDFPYLIPDDRDPVSGELLYSGALVLASRVVFDWFVEPRLLNLVGYGLGFEREMPSNYVARSLRAIAGRIPGENFYRSWGDLLDNGEVENTSPIELPMFNTNAQLALRVGADSNCELNCNWEGAQPLNFKVHTYKFPTGSKTEYIDSVVKPVLKCGLKPGVDIGSNVVSFTPRADNVNQLIERLEADFFAGSARVPFHVIRALKLYFIPDLRGLMEVFNTVDIPDINVFHLSHLLFPQEQALKLTNVALPGDLFMVGHIDPKKTTFTLEPLFGRVKAGNTLQLTIKPLALRDTAVTWSAHNLAGDELPDAISRNGVFSAPDFAHLQALVEHYIITAAYTADDGTLREASALIAVVANSLSVTPSIATLDITTPGETPETVKIRAMTLGTAPLTWTVREDFGDLDVAPDGLSATYTLPEGVPEGAAGLVIIDVEDRAGDEKSSVSILWLGKYFTLPVVPGFHPGLPATASTQLRVADSDIEPDEIVWDLLAGDGTVGADTGLFTAPQIIETPYAVVQASLGDGPRAHRGYGIIHLSNFARKAGWTELKSIRLTSDSVSTTLYSNGLQQVNVNVSVTPKDVGDGQPGLISDEEIGSIELLGKDQHNNWVPLPRVGLAGVPEGGGWGYSIDKNTFDQYPGGPELAVSGVVPRHAARTANYFVQSRLSGTLDIAASMRGDDGLLYFSTAVGEASEGERTITLGAKEPESFDSSIYTFSVKRAAGTDEPDENEDGENDGNDKDLSTIDYFVLELNVDHQKVKFKTVQLEAAKSIVQWESRQFDEDICSFTGYAFSGSNVLNFDPLLYARMPESVRPEKQVKPGMECPEGSFLISLHRCEYWNFDLNCEPDYTSGLKLIIHDVNGNMHRVQVNFKTPTNRNVLVAEKY